MSFYNTTAETGDELAQYRKLAATQKEKLRGLWTYQPFLELTASEAFEILRTRFQVDENTPLTSIRRAMTDLMKDGYLEKTALKRPGPYGRSECVYRRPNSELGM